MMTKKMPIKMTALIIALFMSVMPLIAGGPLLVDGSTRTPFAYAAGDVSIYTDLSDLGILSNAQADALTIAGYDEWTNVASSSFSAAVVGKIQLDSVDTEITIDNVGEVIGMFNGGGIHVVYDNDGMILSDFFGAPPGVAGIATPEFASGTTIDESFAVINGAPIDPADTDGRFYSGVFTHEFGHSINLAHSQTNGAILFFGDKTAPVSCDAPYPGGPADSDLETMYPFIDISVGGSGEDQGTVEHLDDVASISNIYPGTGWPADFGTISGTVFLASGLQEITGINVIARNAADPFGDAISAISGDFTQGQLGPDGIYTFNGLTPGADYLIYIDQIVAGGFSTPGGANLILPGPEEFWNENESSDPNIDDPCDFSPINVSAASLQIADIILNSSSGDLPLGDDDAIEITLAFPFPFCDTTYTSMFVGSNGFISFADSGNANRDFDPSVEEFLAGPARIAGFWTDLSPNAGGSVSVDDGTPGEVSVTFTDVPEFGTANSNNFTFVLRVDGTYDVIYGTVDALNGLAGRTPGQSIAFDNGGTDLTAEAQPIGEEDDLVYEFFQADDNDLANQTFTFALCEVSDDPIIAVDPDTLTFEVFIGGKDTTDLNISNIAASNGLDLEFTIEDNATLTLPNGATLSAFVDYAGSVKNGGFSASSAACAWLNADPTSGSVAAGDTFPVEVSVDATGLAPNVYECELTINSNAVNEPQVVVPVLLTVKVSFDLHDFVFLANDNVSITRQVDSEGEIFSNTRVRFRDGSPSTHTGNITALDRLDFGAGQIINGDATAGNRINNSGTVNGTITEFAVIDSFKLPLLDFSAGGDDVEVGRSDTLELDPGSYGSAVVKVGAVLKLRSGAYYFESFKAEANAVIEADVASGLVSVNVTDNLSLRNDVSVEITPFGDAGSTELAFNSLQTNDVNIGQSAKILGSFVVPNASVEIKDNAVFKGAICAQRVQANQGVTFRHHSSTTPLPVPVPFALNKDDQGDLVSTMPTEFALDQNYPNPFNPSTTIRFALPEAGEVSVKIFNTRGQVIRTLVNSSYDAGIHNITWDAASDNGVRVASGIYFYQLVSQNFKQVRKMILMK